MPKLNQCHEQIAHALRKDGWKVNSKPFRLRREKRLVFVDILATRQINGTRQEILLSEVKCFPNRDSTTVDLYIALGQYLVYRAMLDELNNKTPLYLAVPEEAYNQIFDAVALRAVHDNRVKMIIVDLETESILRWSE